MRVIEMSTFQSDSQDYISRLHVDPFTQMLSSTILFALTIFFDGGSEQANLKTLHAYMTVECAACREREREGGGRKKVYIYIYIYIYIDRAESSECLEKERS